MERAREPFGRSDEENESPWMQKRSFLSFALALAASPLVRADTPFPTRPVRLVVHSSPGGWLDLTTRVLAEAMSERLGQPFLVDNRAGADGLIGIRHVKSAPADGYTILACASTIALQPALKLAPGYDLAKDFAGIGPIARAPFVMVSSANLPYRTLQEYVTWARANPTQVNYASPGFGTQGHIAGELAARHANQKLLAVPYKGVGAALPDVLAGRQNFMFVASGGSLPLIREGKLRALGITSARRLASAPDIPTLAEQGMTNMNLEQYLGLMVPTGVPKDVTLRLADALKASIASPGLSHRFQADGAEAMFATPDEFSAYVQQDARRMAAVLADIGIAKE